MRDARRPTWPFLSTEASLLGITPRQLRGTRYRAVFRGVFVDARVPDTVVTRGRSALLVAPEGAVLSHWTAARLWGGRVPDNDFVHVSFMRRVRWRVRGVKPHCFTHRLEILRRHGLPVTSPSQTFCHLARFLGLVDLVALGDSLVRKGRLASEELAAAADDWVGQCRVEAVNAARLVRDGVDSTPETALRLLMVLAGLPEPRVNITRRRPDGSIRYRIELGYEEHLLAIEYDGRWHAAPDQRARDEVRREGLAQTEGWHFVIVTADELFGHPEELLARLWTELRAVGIAVPARPTDLWRYHFRVQRVAA